MTGFRITELWAFVALGSDDEEGVTAFLGSTGWMPMVAADRNRIEDLRPEAQKIARASGLSIELRRFTTMTTEEVIEP